MKFRLHRVLAAALAVLLAFAAVPVAANHQMPYLTGIETLQAFRIVEGDKATGDLRLADPITRAELAKVLVVAAGKSAEAELLANTTPFPDVPASHWAAGYVAIVKALNITTGYEDGTFRPRKEVTYAETIAFLARLVGVKPKPNFSWPMDYFQAAKEAGIVTAETPVEIALNLPGTRGMVFQLAHNAFRNVRDANGKTLYQRVFDGVAPELISSNVTVLSSSPARVRVEGSVRDNVGLNAVEVGGQTVLVRPDGSFSVDLDLAGSQLAFVLTDAAGNTYTKEVAVEIVGDPARIEAPASLSVGAGSSTPLDLKVLDQNGTQIPNPTVTGTVQGDIGRYDAATRTFIAGQKPGTGTLVLTAGTATATVNITVGAGAVARIVVTPESATLGAGERLQLVAKGYDAAGNEKPITPVWAIVSGDRSGIGLDTATGMVTGGFPGKYIVAAQAGDVTSNFVQIGVYGTPVGLKIEGPDTIVANNQGEAQYKVSAVDTYGNVVANYAGSFSLESAYAGIEAEPVGEPEKGVQIFTVKTTSGAAAIGVQTTLTAESHTAAYGTLTASKGIEVVAQTPAALLVEAPEYLAANSNSETADIAVYVVDQDGFPILDEIWDVEFELSGPANWSGSSDNTLTRVYFGGDPPTPAIATLQSIAAETGPIRITVSAAGLPSQTVTVQATIAGNPTMVTVSAKETTGRAALDDTLEVSVQLKDRNGVPVGGLDELDLSTTLDDEAQEEVYVSIFDPDTQSWGGFERLDFLSPAELPLSSNGAGKFRVRAETFTGTATFKLSGPNVVEGRVDLTFVASSASVVGFTTTGVTVSVSDPTAKMKAQIYDQAGNPVKKAGVAVTFSTASPDVTLNGRNNSVKVTTDANGQAVVDVAARPYITTYVINISADDFDTLVGYESAELQVVVVLPTHIAVEFTDSNGTRRSSIYAGDLTLMRVTVTDAYGGGVAGYAGQLQTKVVTGDMVGSVSFSYEGDGVYEAQIFPTQAPTFKVEVSLDLGASVIKGSGSLGVRAGDPARVFLKRADPDDAVTVKSGKATGPFQVIVTDEFYNQVRPSGSVTVFFDHSGLDGGKSLSIRESPEGTNIDSVTLSSSNMSKSIYIVTNDTNGLTLILEAGGYGSDAVEIEVQP